MKGYSLIMGENKMRIQETGNSKMFKFYSLYILIIFWNFFAFGQSPWYQQSAFSDGEWLKYKVRWGFIRLGTIEIFQEKLRDSNDQRFYVSMCARSANLPFVNVFFRNEGLINPYHPVLNGFRIYLGKKENTISTYIYQPDSKMLTIKTEHEGEITRMDSLLIFKDIYDGVGMFMMMRCLSNSGFQITLNNIIDYKVESTFFNFTGKEEFIKVSAFEEEKSALKFHGNADWVSSGWGGLSGPFNGWISNDGAAIPLKVNIKIFIGSVTLELEEMKRGKENRLSTHNSVTSY
jgi:hypothetical protein